MKNIKFLFLFVLIAFLFTGCATKEVVTGCLTGHTYGFFGGLWHGFIAPFDLFAMIFSDNVTVYATNNSGGWYALGFVFGSGGWGIFAGRSSRK
jgi:hypothetical protein